MRIVDLFSGMGGMTIGAIEASRQLNVPLEIIFACDNSPSTGKFYKQNYEEQLVQFSSNDILDLDLDLIEQTNNIDYLFAGPPCQGHSDLNNSSRRSDPRNMLYLETLELIRHFNPQVFVIENVPSVVHSKEEVVQKLQATLDDAYEIKEYIVDFLKLGIAQTRKRHILIGTRGNLPNDLLNKIYAGYNPTCLRSIIGDLENIESDLLIDSPSRMNQTNKDRVRYLFENNLYDLPNFHRPKCHQSNHSYKSMYGRLHWDKPAQTITGGFGSMGQGRFIHPSKHRVLTPHEAARIQGLPDWLDYNMVSKRGDIQQMIGNAVPPVLSKEIIIEMENSNG